MKFIIAIVCLMLMSPVAAQKLVDPDKVAPEYHEAAVKRRNEQINQLECVKKSIVNQVLPRDRTAFIVHCLDEIDAAKH